MSHLFRELRLTLKFGGSLALDPEELKIYLQAKQEFLEMIPKGLEGADYVQSVYDTMDQLASENTAQFPIVCGSGCSHCCYQMVCCTSIEMKLISDHLQGRSTEKRKIKAKAKKRSLEYYAIIPPSALTGLTTRFEGINDPLRKGLYGRPCPFLRHNKCGIYPVRPPDCRSARVLEKACGSPGMLQPKGLKFFLDQVVADILIEEDLRIKGGDPQIAPFFCWILSQDFHRIFA